MYSAVSDRYADRFPVPPLYGPGLTVAVSPTGNQGIDGLLGALRWAGPVSYGDPSSADLYEPGHPESLHDFAPLTPEQLRAVDETLTAVGPAHAGFSVEGFTDLDIAYAGSDGDGLIRLADTSDPPTAYTYLPDDNPYGGDVFFGHSGRAPVAGNYHYFTVLHELGHALGLKHGNEATGFGALPAEEDSMEFSVMTYRSYVGSNAALHNEPWGYAQTYMMNDIAALQWLYGADFTTGAGDTTYAWSPDDGVTRVDGAAAIVPQANRIFATIWDGGGHDAYDLSAYATGVIVDLGPGRASTFSADQLASLGGGPNDGYARGNVFNARLFEGDPRSLIEDAVGGGGDDRIAGNAADNALRGGAGADVLAGREGADLLDGGLGADSMTGGVGDDRYLVDDVADVARERTGGGADTVVAGLDWRLGGQLESLVLAPGALAGTGNGLDNRLTGNTGANTLAGRGGADHLAGGRGADALIGGAGADVFCFAAPSDSSRRAPDRLQPGGGAAAFEAPGSACGDLIDLSAIDADPLAPGHQGFAFAARHAASSLWLVERAGETVVRASAGSAGELKLVIEDGWTPASAYSAADFLGVA